MADSSSTSGLPVSSADLSEIDLRLQALAGSQLQYNLALESGDRLGRQFGKTLTAALVGLAVQGKSFGDVLSTLALSLSRLAVSTAFKPLESAFGSALQSLVAGPSLFSGSGIASPSSLSIGSGLFSAGGIGSLLGGGETSSGSSSALGGSPNIVFNVTTPNAESFYSSETQIAALLARAVGQGQRNL